MHSSSSLRRRVGPVCQGLKGIFSGTLSVFEAISASGAEFAGAFPSADFTGSGGFTWAGFTSAGLTFVGWASGGVTSGGLISGGFTGSVVTGSDALPGSDVFNGSDAFTCSGA